LAAVFDRGLGFGPENVTNDGKKDTELALHFDFPRMRVGFPRSRDDF
jgi:hypothetical protein